MRGLTRIIRMWRGRVALAASCFALHLAPAGAQILGGPTRPVTHTPPNWLSGGLDVLQQFTLQDGSTQSQWQFDSGLGFTASFEHPTQAGLMIGVQGMFAKPSMTYTNTNPSALGGACVGGCNATGTITQIEALIHSGNGYSFHPVYQLTVGATGFSNFSDQNGDRIGPSGTDFDFSFSLGYGLGFGISSNLGIEAIEEIGTVLHQRTGLSSGSGNYPRIGQTRLSAKFSF